MEFLLFYYCFYYLFFSLFKQNGDIYLLLLLLFSAISLPKTEIQNFQGFCKGYTKKERFDVKGKSKLMKEIYHFHAFQKL